MRLLGLAFAFARPRAFGRHRYSGISKGTSACAPGHYSEPCLGAPRSSILPAVRLLDLAPGLALFFAARPAFAYRPFDGTDGSVAEYRTFELEAGALGYLREGSATYSTPSQVLNYGVIRRVELVLELHELMPSLGTPGPRFGLVDDGAFVKTVLVEGALQGKPGPSLALELGALLPTFHGEPGAGGSAALIGSVVLPCLTFHLNLEGARTRAANADFIVDGIVEGPALVAGARPVAELEYERELHAETRESALFGVIAPIRDTLALDAAARFGWLDDERVFEVRAGFTWAFAVAH